MPDPNPTPTPAVDVTGLEASRNALLSEKKVLQEKYQSLERAAVAAGVDPTDPGAFLAKREAESRARQEREARVKDATIEHLLAAGVPVPPTITKSIIRGAIESSSVVIAEDGTVSGVAEIAGEWLGYIKGSGAGSKPSPGFPDAAPRLPRPSSDTTSSAGPRDFMDLVKQGPVAMRAFAERDPVRYSALKAAHEEGLASPRRGQPKG